MSYFDLDYYARMGELVAGWEALTEIPAERVPSRQDRDACVRLLHTEARLLDRGQLERWLDLFSRECAYWIPADPLARDPRAFVSWELNDRRRMEERIERLRTGRAYSQIPATRTVHVYSNIEAMTAGPDALHVLCNFVIQTVWSGRASARAGWNGYVLRREADRLRIELKRVCLFDADLAQDNNSFTL